MRRVSPNSGLARYEVSHTRRVASKLASWPSLPTVDAQGLIAEVRWRTKLNEHFAGLLLQECNGDLEAAGRRFEEARV